jgi:hypothetical protein
MENIIWEMIKVIVTVYLIYVFVLCFTVTTFTYLTYRFWKMILLKEDEIKVFVTNAPVIWHINNEEE